MSNEPHDGDELDDQAAGSSDEAAVTGRRLNIYARIIEHIFSSKHSVGTNDVPFVREDIPNAASALGLKVPSNVGDVIYTFRYRRPLPDTIRYRAPAGMEWIIRGEGSALYRFVAVPQLNLLPNPSWAQIKILDATPGVISQYAQGDEQALLARVRYNRLVDIFTGITCYSLQSHLRTQVKGVGQLETDELYIGVNKDGAQFVLPIQAKGHSDRLGRVQVEQDLALCRAKFPALICRPIGAQFLKDGAIALFELREDGDLITIVREQHYRLVPPSELSAKELERYNLVARE